MWTEYEARNVETLARTCVALVFLALFAVAALLPLSLALAQATESPDETPWRDAKEAAQQLADAQVRLLDARSSLVAIEERFLLMLNDARVANQETVRVASNLQQTRELAEDLAVEAYINGSPLTDALYLLDSTSANDFAFRASLLNESVNVLLETSRDYDSLQSSATTVELALADDMAEMDRAIEIANDEIFSAELALDKAEWVASIAEINRAAEELIDRYGRTAPTEEQWELLRFCEATSNYSINTGNGFFGAYQFNLITWVDMGGTGLPSDAPPEEQDARALYLYGLRGSGYNVGGPWPECGRHLPR